MIHIDPTFFSSLTKPQNYIPSEQTYEDITRTAHWDDLKKVGPLKASMWWLSIDDMDEYYEQGYNKIEITYKFYTTGTKSLFGGYVNVDCYVSPSGNKSDRVHYQSVPSSKGKEIEKTITTDLVWFKDSDKIYLITDNNNLTESFTVSKLTFEVRIYRE